MAPKKSIKERRASKLTSLAIEATKLIRADKNLTEFNRAWLITKLGVSDKEAAQVASQLKKDLVLFGENRMGDDENLLGTLYRVRPVKP